MRGWKRIGATALVLALLGSLGCNACFLFFGGDALLWESYLQSPEQLALMECGALDRLRAFQDGEALPFCYDFDNGEYARLRERYDIAGTAGEGGAFERAVRLMHAYSGRLTHRSDPRLATEQIRALYLLEYGLDRPERGIHCRAKAQILNEMCLALGIFARKVWLNPVSRYDADCHVVNEVWDDGLGQWVMLDITTDTYWVDETGRPLSVLEIRDRLADRAFCTPVSPEEGPTDPERARAAHGDIWLYIAKNMAYMQYMDVYTAGEGDAWYALCPEPLDDGRLPIVSRERVEAAPR